MSSHSALDVHVFLSGRPTSLGPSVLVRSAIDASGKNPSTSTSGCPWSRPVSATWKASGNERSSPASPPGEQTHFSHRSPAALQVWAPLPPPGQAHSVVMPGAQTWPPASSLHPPASRDMMKKATTTGCNTWRFIGFSPENKIAPACRGEPHELAHFLLRTIVEGTWPSVKRCKGATETFGVTAGAYGSRHAPWQRVST